MDGGFDMRKNLSLAEDTTGTYATDLFTNVAIETIKNHPNNDTPLFMYLPHLAPHSGNRYELLQAPNDEIDKLKHIKNEERRKYAAMVTRLDNSIGKLVRTLGEKNMLENSVIIFCSDNGAPVIGDNLNFGSNVPLRGVSIFVIKIYAINNNNNNLIVAKRFTMGGCHTYSRCHMESISSKKGTCLKSTVSYNRFIAYYCTYCWS